MNMARHGDLLITRVGKLPSKSKKRKSKVLAYGEVTGHAHRLTGGQVFEDKGRLFFKVEDKPVTLKHEEHGPITFEAGVYQVKRQREYLPDSWRQVAD